MRAMGSSLSKHAASRPAARSPTARRSTSTMYADSSPAARRASRPHTACASRDSRMTSRAGGSSASVTGAASPPSRDMPASSPRSTRQRRNSQSRTSQARGRSASWNAGTRSGAADLRRDVTRAASSCDELRGPAPHAHARRQHMNARHEPVPQRAIHDRGDVPQRGHRRRDKGHTRRGHQMQQQCALRQLCGNYSRCGHDCLPRTLSEGSGPPRKSKSRWPPAVPRARSLPPLRMRLAASTAGLATVTKRVLRSTLPGSCLARGGRR